MGQSYDYDIVVREDGLFGKEYLRDTFTFAGDGSQIDQSCVAVTSEGSNVVITISADEMNNRMYKVQVG